MSEVTTGLGLMEDVERFREAVEETREELDADLRDRAARFNSES